MLGYDITISRKAADRLSPAEPEDDRGDSLIGWTCEPWGLHWIDELAKASGDGYPYRYTVRLRDIRGVLGGEEPPMVKAVYKPADPAVVASCDPEEWLIVLAWDQS